jgi:hypothetical protein
MGKFTNLNHRHKCIQAIDDILYWTRQMKKTYGEMLELRKELLFDTNSWQRLPQYMQSYCHGYFDARIKEIWQNDVEWRVYHPDHGHVWRKDYDILDGKWSEVISEGGAHFWRETEKHWTLPENKELTVNP